MVVAKCLGELRGVRIAHPRGYLADGKVRACEERAGVAHPHRRERLAEAAFGELREAALKLAARGADLARHGVEVDPGPVVADDRRQGVAKKIAAPLERAVPHAYGFRSHALHDRRASPKVTAGVTVAGRGGSKGV